VLPAHPSRDTGLEPAEDEGDRLVETLARGEPVALEPEVLDGGDAPTDAVVDTPAGQLVEQADVLDHAQRMMDRQDLDERAEADGARDLGGGGQEDLLVRRHAQVGPVVLGQVIGVEAGLVSDPDEVEPVSEELAHARLWHALDVVEDPVLHHLVSPGSWCQPP